MEEILAHVGEKGKFIRPPNSDVTTGEVNSIYLARFLYIIGHTGIREMVHLDQSIFKELKRRNAVVEKKKELSKNNRRSKKSMNLSAVSTVTNTPNTSTISSASIMNSAQKSIRRDKDEEQEDGMEGATADDTEAEHINMVLEEELLADGGYFSSFMLVITY